MDENPIINEDAGSTIPTKLTDTLFYSIGEKVAPGLIDGLINNGDQLTHVVMSGATNQDLFGISTKGVVSWSSKLSNLLDVSTSNSAWASKMLSLKPYSFVDGGNSVFLTNNQGLAPTSKTVEFPDGVKLSTDSLGFDFLNIGLRLGATTLTYPDGSAYRSPEWIPELESFVKSCGYTPNKNVRPFATYIQKPNQGGYTLPTATMLKNKLSTGGGSNDFVADWMVKHKAELVPGVKWLMVFWTHNGQSKWHRDGWSWTGAGLSIDPNYFNSFFIPIVDDGLSATPALWLSNETVSGSSKNYLTTFTVDDSRYNKHGFGLRYSAAALLRHTGSADHVSYDGQVVPGSSIPATNWSDNWNLVYSSFLPFLICPLDDAYYVIGKVTSEDVDYEHNGSIVTITTLRLSVKEFYCKISKSWYEEYYTTGFGLFSPKSSNIQANILKKWKALDFDSVGVCLTGAAQGFSASNLIENLPLYKEYARAREKACKNNDWYDQPYNDAQKWSAVRAAIAKSPSRNAFFCLNGFSIAAPGFDLSNEAIKAVRWTAKQVLVDGVGQKDALGYPIMTYTRTEGTVVEADLPETAEVIERILDEMAQGAQGPSTTALGMKAGMYENEVVEFDKLRAEAVSGTFTRNANTMRFNMSNDFYFTQQMLGNNGYPAFSYMSSPEREMMVNRCYAELDSVFGPLVRVINSFTDSLVIEKIIKNL